MNEPTSSRKQKQSQDDTQQTPVVQGSLVSRKWPRRILIAILTFIAVLVPYICFELATVQTTLSPQSLKMIKSGMQPTLYQAITTTTVWPPGYPALLFFSRQLHISFHWTNLALLYTAFIITFLFLRRFITTIWAMTAVSGLTLFSFHYYNYAQFTSEALVTPLSLLLLLLLIDYKKHESWLLLWTISLITAATFISRYHILAWLLPVILLVLLLDKRFSLGTRSLRAGIFFCVSTAPVGLYMLMNRIRTGFFTGMPRWGGYDVRPPLPTVGEAAYFANQVSFSDNIRLTFKTYFLDFFSQSTLATHHANRLPYHPSSLEILTLGVFLITVAIATLFFLRNRSEQHSARAYESHHIIPTLTLAVSFYILITIAVWTLGNNDPIYTRFLYPSYLPLAVLYISVMAAVFNRSRVFLYRVFFLLSIVLILTVNMIKLLNVF